MEPPMHHPQPSEKPILSHLGAIWLRARPEMRNTKYIAARMAADLVEMRRKHGHCDLRMLFALGWSETQVAGHFAIAAALAPFDGASA